MAPSLFRLALDLGILAEVTAAMVLIAGRVQAKAASLGTSAEAEE